MRKAFLIIALAVMTVPAFAQRTSPGQFESSITADLIASEGGSVQFGGYTRAGFWDTGIEAHFYDEYTTGASALKNSNVGEWYARGGYMLRALSTRDRTVSFYLGGGIIAGYEKVQRWYEDGLAGSPEENVSAFSAGLYPKAELEVYPFEKLALVVSAFVPVNLLSEKQMARVVSGVGLRYCF